MGVDTNYDAAAYDYQGQDYYDDYPIVFEDPPVDNSDSNTINKQQELGIAWAIFGGILLGGHRIWLANGNDRFLSELNQKCGTNLSANRAKRILKKINPLRANARGVIGRRLFNLSVAVTGWQMLRGGLILTKVDKYKSSVLEAISPFVHYAGILFQILDLSTFGSKYPFTFLNGGVKLSPALCEKIRSMANGETAEEPETEVTFEEQMSSMPAPNGLLEKMLVSIPLDSMVVSASESIGSAAASAYSSIKTSVAIQPALVRSTARANGLIFAGTILMYAATGRDPMADLDIASCIDSQRPLELREYCQKRFGISPWDL